jgi:protein-S-isoprenylcysteine O-methyltransferase Ste14
MLQLVLFFVGSAAILKLSWRSLGDLRLHGFYRFFAFELLWALILANLRVWFRDPLSARQLVSYFLGAASIALAIEGFRLLRVIGRPSPAAGRGANAGILLTLAGTGFFVATAVAEEKENLASFGADRAAYMRRTWRFVPFLF